MRPQGVQLAIRFLARMVSAREFPGFSADVFPSNFDEDSLVRYAATLGYELDAASIAEAFRLRMLARELARRKRSTQSSQSR